MWAVQQKCLLTNKKIHLHLSVVSQISDADSSTAEYNYIFFKISYARESFFSLELFVTNDEILKIFHSDRIWEIIKFLSTN